MKWRRRWRKWSCPIFRYHPSISPEGQETHANLCEDGWYTVRDSNQAHPTYKLLARYSTLVLQSPKLFTLVTDCTQYRCLSAKTLSEKERQLICKYLLITVMWGIHLLPEVDVKGEPLSSLPFILGHRPHHQRLNLMLGIRGVLSPWPYAL
jgi:hypothetical protein